jgi:hypothetical protein
VFPKKGGLYALAFFAKSKKELKQMLQSLTQDSYNSTNSKLKSYFTD